MIERAIDDFEREAAKYADDPASLALLYIDTWEYPYTTEDVARCAVELAVEISNTRRLGNGPMARQENVDRWSVTVLSQYKTLRTQEYSDHDAVVQLAERHNKSERTIRRWLARGRALSSSTG